MSTEAERTYWSRNSPTRSASAWEMAAIAGGCEMKCALPSSSTCVNLRAARLLVRLRASAIAASSTDRDSLSMPCTKSCAMKWVK